MAAAVRVISDYQAEGSPIRELIVQVTGDASYPTGGYPLGTAQGLPAGTVVFATFESSVGSAASQSWTWQFDYVNSKLKVSRDNGELGNGVNAATATARGLVQFKVA